jgi:hypothetical protein
MLAGSTTDSAPAGGGMKRALRGGTRPHPEGGSMLARDQIRSVADEIARSAEQRIHDGEDRFDRQQLWETVRCACRVIEAVAELDGDAELRRADRAKRTRYIIAELEAGLESARQARVIQNWTASREGEE